MSLTLKTVLSGKYDLEGEYGGKCAPDFETVRQLIKLAKQAGYRIVLTQGVYDQYHVAHERYLAEAARFGDILIVGVDSDELTRQMKGDGRPVDRFEERVEVLAGLSFVNLIVKRDVDKHKYALIKTVRPDVLVMSTTTSSFKERDKRALEKYCGRIEHLAPKAPPASVSTTAKIRRLQREGATQIAAVIAKAVEEAVDGYFSGEIPHV